MKLTKRDFILLNEQAENFGRNDLIEAFEKAVIASGDISDIIDFANKVKGADVEILEDVVIERNDMSDILGFARKAQKANINKLQDAILKTGDAANIYWFANLLTSPFPG